MYLLLKREYELVNRPKVSKGISSFLIYWERILNTNVLIIRKQNGLNFVIFSYLTLLQGYIVLFLHLLKNIVIYLRQQKLFYEKHMDGVWPNHNL